MFSIPLNPKLSEKEFNSFIDFLIKYKDYIYDFYFTSRIAPFTQDAMGDVFVNELGFKDAIDAALYVQHKTGVKGSATFNNIMVRPSQQNLDLWIDNFKPLYESGIRSATIPHTHWMATGQIKKNFPELFVKNTILRNVTEPREIVKLANAGFNYINLDRDLMRDHEQLKRIKKAKDYSGVMISLLANEGCAGGCEMMDEHYQFNMTRTADSPQYFNDPISRVTCPKWDFEDPAIYLKTANLTPWKEDWIELQKEYGIDVFKMHGREAKSRLRESMSIIERYANNEEILFDGFKPFIEETNLKDKPIDVWRKKIKTCKFDCWDCGFCDKIYQAKYGVNFNEVITMVTKSLVDSVNNPVNIDIPGLTSTRVQSLINMLASQSKKYLEIGSYLGSTGAAAVYKNNINAYFIDHWSENIKPMNGQNMPNNSKDEFISNIKKYTNNPITIFDGDMLSIDTSQIKDIDLMFYDGPHDPISTSKAIQYYRQCLADTAIIIFDDANWDGVVEGAQDGIVKSKLNIVYSKLMLNDIESERNWWNGIYIVVVTK